MEDWEPLEQRLLAEYGSKIRISWVRKRELGFTVRKHTKYIREQWPPDGVASKDVKIWHRPFDVICLDFHDESMRTFFILKYLGATYES